METIKVGDYCRTKDGFIARLIEKNTWYKFDGVILEEEYPYNYLSKEHAKELIIKSSPNIIDLIEEHDILKIEEQKGIYTICEVEVFKEPHEKYTFLGVRIDNRPIVRKLYELNIKSIVTHEQFSSIGYKVVE